MHYSSDNISKTKVTIKSDGLSSTPRNKSNKKPVTRKIKTPSPAFNRGEDEKAFNFTL